MIELCIWIRPIQWLTAIMGLSHNCATVLATMAVETNGAPIPGPGRTHVKKTMIL